MELYSDSKYVIDGLEKGWAKGWRSRGWVKSDKKPALNPDLWQQLLELCEYHTVNLHWVKGSCLSHRIWDSLLGWGGFLYFAPGGKAGSAAGECVRCDYGFA